MWPGTRHEYSLWRIAIIKTWIRHRAHICYCFISLTDHQFRFQLDLKCKSDLKKFWNWFRLDSDLKCTTLWLQSTDIYWEKASRFQGNTSLASNPGPQESYSWKRESNWPLIQGFPKKWTFLLTGAQGLARLQKNWCILPENPKLQKPLTQYFLI